MCGNNLKRTEEGYIDLKNMHVIYIRQGNFGTYSENWLNISGEMYLCKIPLHLTQYGSIFTDEKGIYAPLIATGIAKLIGVEAAENYIAMHEDGYPRILSKKFTSEREELNSFYHTETNKRDKIATVLIILENFLKSRCNDRITIERIKLDFLKQEFVAKIIGLGDQHSDNTGIITDNDSEIPVRLAPMFDLDFSFFIQKAARLNTRIANNGEDNIESLIEQYKNYPGFISFVRKSLNVIDIDKVFANIYENTGIKAFKDESNNKSLEPYAYFVKGNVKKAKATLRKLLYKQEISRE